MAWINLTKHSSTNTNQTKNNPNWDIYGFLLLENGGKLTLEDQYFIVVSSELQTKNSE